MNLSHRQSRAWHYKLISGVSWALFAKLAGVFALLFTTGLLTRILSKDEIGSYFVLVSFVSVAAGIVQLGMRQPMVRLIARDMTLSNPAGVVSTVKVGLLATTFSALFFALVLIALLGDWLAFSVFKQPMIAAVLGLLSIWTVASALHGPVVETFRGLGDVRMASIFDNNFMQCVLLVFVACVWVFDLPMSFEVTVRLACLAVVVSLFLAVLLAANSLKNFPRGPVRRFSELMQISVFNYGTSVVNLLMMNIGVFIASIMLNGDDLAEYAAAWRIMNVVALPLALVNSAVQPILSELHSSGDSSAFERVARSAATLAALPAFSFFVFFVFFGAYSLELVFGSGYGEAGVLLVLLSAGQSVNAWSGCCGLVLLHTGRHKALMLATILGAVVAVFLIVSLTFIYGVTGLAMGTAIGLASRNLILWGCAYRLTGIRTEMFIDPRGLLVVLKKLLMRTLSDKP